MHFKDLGLDARLLNKLNHLAFDRATEIQQTAVPVAIAGKDILASSKTGSGKTLAFLLPAMQRMYRGKPFTRRDPRVLILTPTRELAKQIFAQLRTLNAGTPYDATLIVGGENFNDQVKALRNDPMFVVATPGRFADHLEHRSTHLDGLEMLILDEADRMLEMGFQDSLDVIIDAAPSDRQTLLFSATFPDQIASIAKRIMKNPVQVKVESSHDDSSISQHFYKVSGNEARLDAVRLLLNQHRPESCVIFCNTKREAQEMSDDLEDFGFSSIALHGDLEQRERDRTLVLFSNKSKSILVATDVAARGLDIDNLDMVINYHLARDTEVHVHRIGRTGRAGSKGLACSLFSDKEHYKVKLLEDYLDREINGEALPAGDLLEQPTFRPEMTTLMIDGGKKQKVRPGDILGALTGDNGIAGSAVGKINVFDHCAYVAVKRDVAREALQKLEKGRIKGRNFRSRQLR